MYIFFLNIVGILYDWRHNTRTMSTEIEFPKPIKDTPVCEGIITNSKVTFLAAYLLEIHICDLAAFRACRLTKNNISAVLADGNIISGNVINPNIFGLVTGYNQQHPRRVFDLSTLGCESIVAFRIRMQIEIANIDPPEIIKVEYTSNLVKFRNNVVNGNVIPKWVHVCDAKFRIICLVFDTAKFAETKILFSRCETRMGMQGDDIVCVQLGGVTGKPYVNPHYFGCTRINATYAPIVKTFMVTPLLKLPKQLPIVPAGDCKFPAFKYAYDGMISPLVRHIKQFCGNYNNNLSAYTTLEVPSNITLFAVQSLPIQPSKNVSANFISGSIQHAASGLCKMYGTHIMQSIPEEAKTEMYVLINRYVLSHILEQILTISGANTAVTDVTDLVERSANQIPDDSTSDEAMERAKIEEMAANPETADLANIAYLAMSTDVDKLILAFNQVDDTFSNQESENMYMRFTWGHMKVMFAEAKPGVIIHDVTNLDGDVVKKVVLYGKKTTNRRRFKIHGFLYDGLFWFETSRISYMTIGFL